MMIESMKEKEKIIDENNMMKENDENFRNNHWNEEFPDEIELKMNDNDFDHWNEGFFDEIDLNMNNDNKLNEEFDNNKSDKEFGENSIDMNINDDDSQIVIYY